jgi:hypothetical protein
MVVNPCNPSYLGGKVRRIAERKKNLNYVLINLR